MCCSLSFHEADLMSLQAILGALEGALRYQLEQHDNSLNLA